MTTTPFVLGLIPARGGSKGVVRKNLRPLGGKPLIEHTIFAALASKTLSVVVTSTEDGEIAEIAQRCGSEVLIRPMELARDETPTVPVVQHAVSEVTSKRGVKVDFVVVLQATTPFRTGSDIDAAVEELIQSRADSVVSVVKVEHFHPCKLKKIVNGQLVPYNELEVEGTRRQDLATAFVRNGGIYAARADIVMQLGSLYGADCRPYIMPPERSMDIDTEFDLLLAESLLASQNR